MVAVLQICRSLNSITVDTSQNIPAKRLDLNQSLNFLLPPEWVQRGSIHFQISHINIEEAQSDIPCNNCDNLNVFGFPDFSEFVRTNGLTLVLAPYFYGPASLTPDTIITPMVALQWMNNAYPVAGNFPSDNPSINLLRVLPISVTNRDLRTFDAKRDFLDDLEAIRFLLTFGSGGIRIPFFLFAFTPCGCGGIARKDSAVAFGDDWAFENGPAGLTTNFEGDGNTWSHEIGHLLGLNHAGNSHQEATGGGGGGGGFDPNFPSNLHGGIEEPGLALNTYWWNSYPFLIAPDITTGTIGPHAHDFMSYGKQLDNSGPMGSNQHTFTWVSPYDYGKLFTALRAISSTVTAPETPRTTSEKLAAFGRFNSDGTATLRPFYRLFSDAASTAGATGDFSIDLLDKNGRALMTHRFSGAKTDDVGKDTTLSFAELIPWKSGIKTIVIKRMGVILAKRVVSENAPQVRVLTPKDGEMWGPKGNITWEGTDPDGDALTYSIFFNSGLDSTWWPIATGLKTPSFTVDTTLLPGSKKARIRLLATDGVNSSEAYSDGYFQVDPKPPLIGIASPRQGETISRGFRSRFVGMAYDPKDGLLPNERLVWTSDRDGLLGRGREIAIDKLSTGSHVITLTATNNSGLTGRAQAEVFVGQRHSAEH